MTREEKLLELDKLARELRELTENYRSEVGRINYEIVKLHPDFPNSGIGLVGVGATKDLNTIDNFSHVCAILDVTRTNIDNITKNTAKRI